jgi:hypothetical protein
MEKMSLTHRHSVPFSVTTGNFHILSSAFMAVVSYKSNLCKKSKDFFQRIEKPNGKSFCSWVLLSVGNLLVAACPRWGGRKKAG